MIIKREICGVVREFELTPQELTAAYYERQAAFDLQDVEDYFEQYSDDEIHLYYGTSKAEVEAKYDEIASEMRRNINKYEMGWYEARETAINDIILWELKGKKRL